MSLQARRQLPAVMAPNLRDPPGGPVPLWRADDVTTFYRNQDDPTELVKELQVSS